MMVIWSCYIPNKFHMSRWALCMCYRSNLFLGYSIFKLAYFFQTKLIYVLILMWSDNKIVFECLFVLGPFLPVFFFHLYSSAVCPQTYLFIVHN